MTEKIALSLKSLLVPSKTVEVEFPGFDGFKVKISYLSRENLVAIRKKATKQVLKSRTQTEELNEELFLQLYADAAIKGWGGLKLSFLEQLALVDISGEDVNSELPYSGENAHFLMKNSVVFDAWISEQVTNLGNFQTSSANK